MLTPPRLAPLPFAQAIAWARAREVVLPEVYYGSLQSLARQQAFTVSGVETIQQLQAILDSLVGALETGEPFGAWQARVAAGEIPLETDPWHAETVFRNATQNAYNRGRYEQQAAHVDTHPWWVYDAIDDTRTRPSHAAMDGYVGRYDDPTWDTWDPSNGHNCRCRRIAVTEAQAQALLAADRRRIETDADAALARANAQPDPGWDTSVRNAPSAGLHRVLDRLERDAPAGGLLARPEMRGALDELRAALDGEVPDPDA
jgi:SPP1 gp7 family putative phage head morphogenesis protein